MLPTTQKIWTCGCFPWYIIQHYFAENLTYVLTLGMHWYRSSNLVLHLKMWENLESNPPVCSTLTQYRTPHIEPLFFMVWFKVHKQEKVANRNAYCLVASKDFQTTSEGEIWCLLNVNFCNSSPVYCTQLYSEQTWEGTHSNCCLWMSPFQTHTSLCCWHQQNFKAIPNHTFYILLRSLISALM